MAESHLQSDELTGLINLRRNLHRFPERSGEEGETARRIVEFLHPLSPAALYTGVGGHGVLAVFDSPAPGPTLCLRADLDALPIQELEKAEWTSTHPGTAHLCGHDGHMATLCGAGLLAHRLGLKKGRLALLFQPAEENGSGARAVAASPVFQALNPDSIFALHNFPEFDLGRLVTRSGAMHCASTGISIALSGSTAHAAWPEHGCSPAAVMALLFNELPRLPHRPEFDRNAQWITVVHARLGEQAFGTSPGEGVVMATLRSVTDDGLHRLITAVEALVAEACRRSGLRFDITWDEPFDAVVNSVSAVEKVKTIAQRRRLDLDLLDAPLRVSEDFGLLIRGREGALIGLGAGSGCAALHRPDYDFPDALIETGVAFWAALIDEMLGFTSS